MKSDAVGDPGAVMVHFQDALVALTAVMTPVRFAFHASLAHANATVVLSLYWKHLISTAVQNLFLARRHTHKWVVLIVLNILSIFEHLFLL